MQWSTLWQHLKLSGLISLVLLTSLICGTPLSLAEKAKDGFVSTIDTLPVDWTAFWTKFRIHAKWDLQWYDQAQLRWVSIKQDLTIERNYPDLRTCKISLIFNASKQGNYRLTFAIDRPLKEYWTQLDKWRYVLRYREYNVVFDWSDIKDIPNLQISHGIKRLANKDWFWFRVRKDNIAQGTYVEIDPSIVATPNEEFATSWSHQTKIVYAESRYWAWYSDGSKLGYKTSTDGSTWSSWSEQGNATAGYDFSVCFNGSQLALATEDDTDIKFRSGTLSGGSINWSDDWTTIATHATYNYFYPHIAFDSNGYPWVAYFDSTNQHVYVTKSDWNNGSWHTETGFPFQVSTVQGGLYRPRLVALNNGKMYVAYATTNDYLRMRLYNTTWFGEETKPKVQQSYAITFKSYGDTVHLSYLEYYYDRLIYYQKTGSWSSKEILLSSSGVGSLALAVDNSTGNGYMLYEKSSTGDIYGFYYDGDWSNASEIWTTNTDLVSYSLQTEHVNNNEVAVLWTEETGGSSYNIKFAIIRADTITVTLQADPLTLETGQSSLITWSLKWDSDQTTVSNYLIDINANGQPWATDQIDTSEEAVWYREMTATFSVGSINFSDDNLAWAISSNTVTVTWEEQQTGGTGSTPTGEDGEEVVLPTKPVIPPIAHFGLWALAVSLGVVLLGGILARAGSKKVNRKPRGTKKAKGTRLKGVSGYRGKRARGFKGRRKKR